MNPRCVYGIRPAPSTNTVSHSIQRKKLLVDERTRLKLERRVNADTRVNLCRTEEELELEYDILELRSRNNKFEWGLEKERADALRLRARLQQDTMIRLQQQHAHAPVAHDDINRFYYDKRPPDAAMARNEPMSGGNNRHPPLPPHHQSQRYQPPEPRHRPDRQAPSNKRSRDPQSGYNSDLYSSGSTMPSGKYNSRAPPLPLRGMECVCVCV